MRYCNLCRRGWSHFTLVWTAERMLRICLVAAHPASGTTVGRGAQTPAQNSSAPSFWEQVSTMSYKWRKDQILQPIKSKEPCHGRAVCCFRFISHTSAVISLTTPGYTHQLHLVGGDGGVEGITVEQLCSSLQPHLTALCSEAPGSVTLLEQQVF